MPKTKISRSNKSQIWYTDFIIGLSIFTLMLFVVFRYTTLKTSDNAVDKERVFDDSQRISESLLSQGIPENWTVTNVKSIGILTDTNVLDNIKIDMLKNLTTYSYDKTRGIMGIRSDFILHFETIKSGMLNITNETYIGKPGFTDQKVIDGGPQSNLFYTRYLVYRHDGMAEIVAMKILVWQQ